MKEYHYIWLRAHPNRTEDWLRERLEEGFDIHHADGDHFNNDWRNLVLIEASDHMRLHGSSLLRLIGEAKEEAKRSRNEVARIAYELKDDQTTWAQIGARLYPESLNHASIARGNAAQYAADAGLPFPKPNSSVSERATRTRRENKTRGQQAAAA